jgi:hypothetical protein
VQITRVCTPASKREGAAQDDEHVRALLSSVSEELDRRIAAWPDAWLGLFAPPRLQHDSDPR